MKKLEVGSRKSAIPTREHGNEVTPPLSPPPSRGERLRDKSVPPTGQGVKITDKSVCAPQTLCETVRAENVFDAGFQFQDKMDGLLKQINSLPGVMKELTRDDVYIRPLRLAGDALDSYHGRFRTEDLPKLLELTNGAPTLIGHDIDKLAVGRFFGGEVVQRNGVNYIMPFMYLLKDLNISNDLRAGIDGGVYNEASIGFRYSKPECSICGGDIRRMSECEHWPGEEYDGEVCHYWYTGIRSVLEGSIVYRGAQPGTGFEGAPEGSLMAALKEKKNSQQMKLMKQIPPLSPPLLRKGGESRKSKVESQNTKMEGEMEITLNAEVIGRLANELGEFRSASELVELVEKQEQATAEAMDLVDVVRAEDAKLKAEIEKLKPKAELGDQYVKSLKEQALAADRKLCALKNHEQGLAFPALIGNTNDVKLLKEIIDDKVQELEEAAPALKCQDCGSVNITRRQSVEIDPSSKLSGTPPQRVRDRSGFII